MHSLRFRIAAFTFVGGVLAVIPVVLVVAAWSDPSFWMLATALIAGGFVGAGAGWIAGNWPVRELDALREITLRAADGDLAIDARPAAIREINDLARALNRLIGRFERAEHSNTQERRWVEAIFDGLQDGIMLVDADEQVIAANHRSGLLLGHLREIPAGQRLVVLTRDYEIVGQYREVLQSGEPSTRTVQHLRSQRSIEITVLPVETEGERFGLIVLRDVTELQRLEVVRSEFVANVSHELKTPLASIRALADTLEAGAVDDPSVSAAFLGRIVFEVDRLNALVDELLDLGRLESERLVLDHRWVDPLDLIEQTAARLQTQIEGAGLTLVVEEQAGIAPVLIDGPRIEQVLINLIQNAVRFTPAGGSIVVRASELNGNLRIKVIDTGVGIRDDELPRLFERFYKSDPGRASTGTGLGLAISKYIILAHGGQISATSMFGQGSTFTVVLPMEPGLRRGAANITNDSATA